MRAVKSLTLSVLLPPLDMSPVAETTLFFHAAVYCTVLIVVHCLLDWGSGDT